MRHCDERERKNTVEALGRGLIRISAVASAEIANAQLIRPADVEAACSFAFAS